MHRGPWEDTEGGGRVLKNLEALFVSFFSVFMTVRLQGLAFRVSNHFEGCKSGCWRFGGGGSIES